MPIKKRHVVGMIETMVIVSILAVSDADLIIVIVEWRYCVRI